MKAIPQAAAQAPWAYQFPHAVVLSEGAVACTWMCCGIRAPLVSEFQDSEVSF